ncbi:MAG TPA: hypothetical protein DD638_11395 [Pasteurellaceae bacterium]|nr:hypothetical protein [Pasteurellaceae bacterium]
MNYTNIFLIFLFLMSLQALGAFIQVKHFRKVMKQMHQGNNLAVGGKKKIFNSEYIIMTCNNSGIILDVRKMAGMTIFARFKQQSEIIGKNINEMYEYYKNLSMQTKGRYDAYTQALNILKNRIETNI